jgi:hypothetical protein
MVLASRLKHESKVNGALVPQSHDLLITLLRITCPSDASRHLSLGNSNLGTKFNYLLLVRVRKTLNRIWSSRLGSCAEFRAAAADRVSSSKRERAKNKGARSITAYKLLLNEGRQLTAF